MSAINFFEVIKNKSESSSGGGSSSSCIITSIQADKVIETPLKCFISKELKDKIKQLKPTDLTYIEKKIQHNLNEIETLYKQNDNKLTKPRNFNENGFLFFQNKDLVIKSLIDADKVQIDLLNCSGNFRNCEAKNIKEFISVLDKLKIDSEFSLSAEEW